jgi:alpha/beta hydrolase fold
MMAGFGGFRVISVDYRPTPEAYFPAALDDECRPLSGEQQVPRRVTMELH